MLFGRSKELAALLELQCEAAAGSGRTAVTAGVAGIGKTALLAHVLELARADGCDVRACRGEPSQQMQPFAAIRALFPEHATLFGTEDDLPESATPVSILALHLLSGVSEQAQHHAIFVVVDDAQWIDPSSIAVLRFFARRLFADRVMVLFGLRTEDETHLASASPWYGFPLIELGPLSAESTIEVLVDSGLDAAIAARVAPLTGGLPLLMGEVSSQILNGNSNPTVSLPDRYTALLQTLSPEVLHAVLLVAIEPDADVVSAVLRIDAVVLLEEVELSILEPIRGAQIRFRHPLIRAAALRTLTVAQLRTLHRRVADALDPRHDADRIARHRGAAAEPGDDEAAELLAAFAVRARRRGA